MEVFESASIRPLSKSSQFLKFATKYFSKAKNAMYKAYLAKRRQFLYVQQRAIKIKDELEKLKLQLSENQKVMTDLEKTWQQRLEETEKRSNHTESREKAEARRKEQPHLWNLNEDPALTDMIIWFIEVGENCIGNLPGDSKSHIWLKGPSIQPEHGVIHNKDNKKITIKPVSTAAILVNGKHISQETELQQNDRIHFGVEEISHDMAQKEIAKNVGGVTSQIATNTMKSKEDMILEEDLVNILPNVYRANAMAKELKRNVNFEIVLMPPEIRGDSNGNTQVWIKVHNKTDDTTFLWDINRFNNRYNGMQEMYQNYTEGDLEWNLSKERDPFYEPADSSIVVGSTKIYLQSLAYMLSVCFMPCNPAGKEILGEFVENPSELVKKNLAFKIKILSALGLPRRIDQSYCTYTFFDRGETKTNKASGSNPAYAHEEMFTFRPVTQELVGYLKNGALNITVYGIQKARDSSLHSSAASSRISSYLNQVLKYFKLG
uniref:Kinesin-like protein n=1 Tax=Ditylenchus dipsaci TaxID=166011 RepID=A0A915D7L4_9BILA